MKRIIAAAVLFKLCLLGLLVFCLIEIAEEIKKSCPEGVPKCLGASVKQFNDGMEGK